MARTNNSINIRQENVNRYLKRKVSLKKIGITLAAITVIASSVGIGHHVYNDVQIPEGYDSKGISVSATENLMLKEDVTDDFILLESNNWKKGVSDDFINNISLCNANNIPCGVIINSDAKTEKEAKADAAVLNATLDSYNVNCPIYYNVNEVVESLDETELLNVYNVFSQQLNTNDEKYEVRLAISEDKLNSLSNDLDNINKMIICEDKEISYNGMYDTCYFTRTDTYFSSNSYQIQSVDSEISDNVVTNNVDPFEGLYKGIDISEYQGKIDWETVSSENVDFAILRLTCFPKFHDGQDMKVDEMFHTNIAECDKYNIPYGIYCYTKAETVAEAKREARTVVEYLKENNIKVDLPIYYDIEGEFHFENPKLSAKLTKAFCGVIEDSGYKSGLYASYSLIKDMVQEDESIKDYEKWVAYYKYDHERGYDEVLEGHIPDMPGIGKYRVAQVTQSAKLEGIEANTVDVNFTVSSENEKQR